jgi:uncharacterized protein YbcI
MSNKKDKRLDNLDKFAEQVKNNTKNLEHNLSQEEKEKIDKTSDEVIDSLLDPDIIQRLGNMLGSTIELTLWSYKYNLIDSKHVKIILTIKIGSKIALETIEEITNKLFVLKAKGMALKVAPQLITTLFKGTALPI